LRRAVLLFGITPLFAVAILTAFAQSSTFSLTSQLNPIKGNPDGTYYPGDSFQIIVYPHVQLSGGDSLVGITYSWFYGPGMFSVSGTNTSKVFTIFLGASPGTYNITISDTATFVYNVNGTAH
jgi:hypothetical protein